MASFIITIPDGIAPEVVDAFCEKHGWTENSALTKTQFAKRMIRDYVKQVYIDQNVLDVKATRAELSRQAQEDMEGVEVN